MNAALGRSWCAYLSDVIMLNIKEKKSILILFGSPRKNGFTAKLTNELISQLQNYYTINIVNAYDENITPCISCDYCVSHPSCFMPDFKDIDVLLKAADLIVVASPVYNLGFPAPLKAIFDRMQPYFNAKFKNKSEVFSKQKNGILLLTCGSDKNKSQHIIIPQLELIFRVLNTKLSHIVTMDNSDFAPNLEESLTQIKLICEKLK